MKIQNNPENPIQWNKRKSWLNMVTQNQWISFYEWYKFSEDKARDSKMNMVKSEKTQSLEERQPKKRKDGHKWELAKGGETYTATPFPPINPVIE